MMKKIIFIMALAIISLGAYSQTSQGDSSFGLSIGGGFDDPNHVTLGIDYRYNFTDEVRFSPSITYFAKNKGLSALAIDLNAHYVFPLTEYFGFYPLGGMNISFWKWKHDLPMIGKLSSNETRIGANIGLGGELYASEQLTIGVELKYLIIKDVDQAMAALRIGYNF